MFGPATAAAVSLAQLSAVHAFTATPVSLPDLDLSPLGRLALTGNFDSISLYSYLQQSESAPSKNGSQSLLTALPNGVLTTLSSADADILAMCSWTRKDGTFAGLILGGNFTSFGGTQAEGIASFDPTTNTVHNMSGLSGTVRSLVCDQDADAVYVGGDFTVKNSTNAMIWNGSTGWQALPFGGFNGPISAIVQNTDGHVIFGGSFDGLGNATTPKQNFSQIVNLSTANVSSDAQTTLSGFIDPRNVICSAGKSDSAGNTWLLDDYSPGYWRADMGFTFYPTKVRLYNTHYQGRGTKSFRFQALPDTGFMNLTYTDPSTGKTVPCDAECPLSSDTSEAYRDFELVNPVGMSGFMIQIMDWYGQGAGLDGIEIFQNEIYTYAINNYNEPNCTGINYPSTALTVGDWTVTPAGSSAVSSTSYLTAKASGSSNLSVTFKPDITQSGNYTILVYTPGCSADGTCDSRGSVNVTATLSSSTQEKKPIESILWQTNQYEKYDTIYTGYVEASGDNFRPEVTITPVDGNGETTVVASRVAFQLINSTGGLNGLYDYDPTKKTTDTDFASDAIDSIGTKLNTGAVIHSMVQSGDTTFVGGNFSDSSFRNIMSFTTSGNATSLSDGGLNSYVQSLLLLDDIVYVGGNFTDTAKSGTKDLNYIAAYSPSSKSWSSLGAGVNGPVTSVVSFPVNGTNGTTETAIAVSGQFDQVLAFGSNSSATVTGFAVWVPSQKNWLQNVDSYPMAYYGQLMATADIGNNTTILAGSLSSDGISSRGVVSLEDASQLSLQPLPIDILASKTGSVSKRDITSQDSTEVAIGLFDTTNGRNLTIFGGQFTAKDSNGSTIQNLLFVNGSDSDSVTGIPSGINSNSTFTTLAVSEDTLFAGGTVTGKVGSSSLNGLVVYDLVNSAFASSQPPALTGDNVVTNSIAVRPSSTEVYVGGAFDDAGALPCPAVCVWDTSSGQWSRPGANMQGVVTSLQWVGKDKLYVAGNLTVQNNSTMIATYDASSQKWSAVDGASSPAIPGPVSVFGAAATDLSSYWVAGQASNGSTFLVQYDGSQFNSAGQIFGKSTSILGLQVIGLSTAHTSTDVLNDDQILLVTGQLEIPGFGNASAALYNGTTLTPFILSSTSDGQPGSIQQMFTENKNTFTGDSE